MKVSLLGTEMGCTWDYVLRHLELMSVKPLAFKENDVFLGRWDR